MYLRLADDTLEGPLVEVCERLVVAPFEKSLWLTGRTLADVVDEFWPVADGWVTVSVEPGFYSVLTLLEHPRRGFAAALIGAAEPGNLGSPQTWDVSEVATRARGIFASHHAQGATRLNVLDQFTGVQSMSTLDESMLARLLHSPVFMDEETAVMVALTTGFQRLVQIAEKRRVVTDGFVKLGPVAAR